MIVVHVKPSEWVDEIGGAGIQPSAVAAISHVASLSEDDFVILRGVSGIGVQRATFDVAFNAGINEVSHGLGKVPFMWSAVMVCVVANNNWSVGDELALSAYYAGSGSAEPIESVAVTTTKFSLSMPTGFGLVAHNRTTGAVFTIAVGSSSWKLRFKAIV